MSAVSSAGVPSATTTSLVVVSAVFPVLSGVATYFRFIAHRKSTQSIASDDLWLLVTWVSSLCLSILVWVVASRSGINHYTIDAATGTQYSLALIWLSSVILQLPGATVKIAILLFYKRIFPTRTFRKFIWTGICVVSIWGLLFFILILIQVDPISKAWTGKARLRFDSTALGLAQVGTSIGLDFMVLLFPLPLISRLHMKIERKIAVGLIFWLGAFCCIAAVVRLVLLKRSLSKIVANENMIWLQGDIVVWKIIEPNASIIAACLPTYGTYFKGSRPLEAMIKSVRSVVSLRSLRNVTRGSKDSGARTGRNFPHGHVLSNDSLELRSGLTSNPVPVHFNNLAASGDQGKLSHDTQTDLLPEETEQEIDSKSRVMLTQA